MIPLFTFFHVIFTQLIDRNRVRVSENPFAFCNTSDTEFHQFFIHEVCEGHLDNVSCYTSYYASEDRSVCMWAKCLLAVCLLCMFVAEEKGEFHCAAVDRSRYNRTLYIIITDGHSETSALHLPL